MSPSAVDISLVARLTEPEKETFQKLTEKNKKNYKNTLKFFNMVDKDIGTLKSMATLGVLAISL